jgi:HlyD family secretion protein
MTGFRRDETAPARRLHMFGRLRGRQRAFVALAGAAAVVAGAGLAASTLIRSPAQVAAETAPPPPDVLTATVVKQVLAEQVVMRGTFSLGQTFSVAPTSIAATSGNPSVSRLVVNRVMVTSGGSVSSGQVLAEVSGGPVFVLQGAFPAYRDMVEGESGPDIGQLQDALAALGFPRGSDPWGVFGVGTAHAVTAFYQSIGYPVPVTASPSAGTEDLAATRVPAENPVVATSATPSSTAAVPGKGSPTTPAPRQSPSPTPTGGRSSSSEPGRSSSPAPTPGQSSAPAVVPMVPMSEAWFIPVLPAHVAGPVPSVGEVVQGQLLQLSIGGLTLTGQLDPAQAPLIKPGMPVLVESDTSSFQATGTVQQVGTQQQSAGGADQPYLPMTVTRRGSWPPSLNGADVQLTVTAASTGNPVLAVPQSAVTANADGQTSVTLVAKGEVQQVVLVRTGASVGGFVEVTPLSAGALQPGDSVVVGKASTGG